MVIVIQPFYARQLNKALRNDAPVVSPENTTPKLDSYGMDIKIGYYFNKNINNDKKNFF